MTWSRRMRSSPSGSSQVVYSDRNSFRFLTPESRRSTRFGNNLICHVVECYGSIRTACGSRRRAITDAGIAREVPTMDTGTGDRYRLAGKTVGRGGGGAV